MLGVILLVARMNDAIGGSITYLGLLLPIVPVGYALFHLHECWRRLCFVLAGTSLIGLSILLELG